MGTSHAELGLGEIQEIVSARVPERAAFRWRGRSYTHAALTDRSRRLANAFVAAGLGSVTERSELQRWETGQDFVGIMMYNRPEFIESLFGCFKARCVPFNINYRYGADEIRELLRAAPTRALVFESAFAATIDELADDLDGVLLIEVTADGTPAVAGAVDFESLLAAASAEVPARACSPDDLYVVFTGGTTGRPKAVMWRQGDVFSAALGGPERKPGDRRPADELVIEAISKVNRFVLPAPPFMHGGGQWVALGNLLAGNTVVIQDVVDRLDVADVCRTIEGEHVGLMLITGNAYGIPLIEEIERAPYDLSSLLVIVTGAVAMSAEVKTALLRLLPHARVVETVGTTESGTQLRSVTSASTADPGAFDASADTVVLSEDRQEVLPRGHRHPGWLARRGRVPLGYLGDADKTLATFPEIDGVRYSVPGDRVLLLSSGEIRFLGRDSATINTGGEKVFAEEVEDAIAECPEVYDVVVAGRAHPRWGQEVVAIVSLRDGASIGEAEIKGHVGDRLARYKVPKQVLIVDRVQRNDVGKPDYVWAEQQAIAAAAQAAAMSSTGEAR